MSQAATIVRNLNTKFMKDLLPKNYYCKNWLTLFLTVFLGIMGMNANAQCPVDARFVSSNVYICQGQSITFTNTSTGNPSFFAWAENAVSFSSQASPTRTFPTPGNYLIQMFASNGTCTDSASTLVVVGPAVTSSATTVSPTCFGGSNGSINLSPAGGTRNISLDNARATNDYTTANSVTNAGYSGGITVEAWVKPRSTWTSGDGLFAAFNYGTGTANRFFVGYNPGFQQFVYYDDNLGNQFQAGTAARGVWHHVTVTISSSNVMNLYVNGVLRKTATTNANWIPQAGDLFSMGQEWDLAPGLVTSQHFDGNLDEFRVWNAVLSPSTIASNYSGCMSVNPSHPNWANLVAYYSFNEGSGGFVFDRSGKGNHGTRVGAQAWGTFAQTNWGCFNAGTGYGYSWSNGATVEDPTGLVAGGYTCTITDGAGCTRVQGVTITNPSPVVITTNPATTTPICAGNAVNITASGANTYAWSPAAGLSATTGTTVSASPATTSTYTVTGTTSLGCSASVNIQVVVNPLPTAAISGSSTICIGDTTSLLASGGTSYAWSNGPSAASNPVSPSANTTYIVTVTDNNTCQDTAQVHVIVNALPVVNISGVDTICLGDTTTLTASGGTGYNWSNGGSSASQDLSPSTTTAYTVTVTDANTCENTGSITVTVNALPIIGFVGQDTICDFDTTFIMATGASSYLWSTGLPAAGHYFFPNSTTTYSVVGTDGNGCSNTDSITIVVNPLPVATITGADTICEGDTTSLTGAGGISYAWSNSATTNVIQVSPISSTTYMLTVTDGNGCSNNTSQFVAVNAAPIASITGQDTICVGDTTTLFGAGGFSYLWSTSATSNAIQVAPNASTTYMLTVTDGNGCEGSTSQFVLVNALPIVSIVGNDSICAGDTLSLVASGGTSYLWSTSHMTSSILVSPSASSSYTVTATDNNGCNGTASHNVTVSALPATPVIMQNGNQLSTTAGFATYQWYLNGSPIAGATAATHNGTQSGDYTVVVTNAQGCSASSSVFSFIFVGITNAGISGIDVNVYPNPNNGQFILQLDLDKALQVELRIFDLLGRQVWNHSEALTFGEWKQNIDLTQLSKGTYFIEVRTETGKISRKVVIE